MRARPTPRREESLMDDRKLDTTPDESYEPPRAEDVATDDVPSVTAAGDTIK